MKPVRKAVLPVAGFGTRVLPATKAVPKEMLTVFDRPALQYVVDEAREAGIERVLQKPVAQTAIDQIVSAVRNELGARGGAEPASGFGSASGFGPSSSFGFSETAG